MLQLKKFPDIPVSTREEALGSRPHPEEPRFGLLARKEGSIPCVHGRETRRSRRISKGANSTGKTRGTPGSFHHSQRPPDVSVHSRESCFPCTASTFKPRIDSHHGGTWDSPVGKPRGKATDPFIHAKGSVTLLLLLGRKALVRPPIETRTDSPGETPEVPQDPCKHWRGILRFRNRLLTRS